MQPETYLNRVSYIIFQFVLKSDLKQAVDEIETKNDLGVYLGFNLFKKRVKKSKNKILDKISPIIFIILSKILFFKGKI